MNQNKLGLETKMDRNLNRKQIKIILSDIQYNKSIGYQDPYQLRNNTLGKLMKANDFETLSQNVESYLYNLRMNDGN